MRTVLVLALAAMGSFGCVESYDTVEIVVAVGARPPRCEHDAFEKGLQAWGAWSEDATYGTVWTPSNPNFVPYATDGDFVDLGGEVSWVSDVPWGETLHRGWWVRSRDRWRWVPGTVRSGAVVRWIQDGERTAWAPAAPPRIRRCDREEAIALRDDAPVVGERRDDELAVTVLDAPQTTDEQASDATSAADDEQLRAYANVAASVREAGEEAADELLEDDGFSGSFGSARGGHGGHGGHGGRGGHGSSHHSASSHSRGASSSGRASVSGRR